MQHPELAYLIQREIQLDRTRRAEAQRRMPPTTTVHPLRVRTGRALVTMGNWIAAAPRPAANPPAVRGAALASAKEY